MSRTRSLSLSLSPPRPASSSPPRSPPSAVMSIQSLVTSSKPARYSPYHHARAASFSSGRSHTGVSPFSDDEGTSGSDSESVRSGGTCVDLGQALSPSPLISRLSRLALSRLSPPAPLTRSIASKRLGHRRTQSLITPPSFGYILLPSSTPTAPTFSRRHSEVSPRSATFRTPSPPIPKINVVGPEPTSAPMPLTPAGKATFDRMMLVNPAIAAHLKRGGAVNMRTPDGTRRWKVRLQKEGGKLQGVVEEAERLAPSVPAV